MQSCSTNSKYKTILILFATRNNLDSPEAIRAILRLDETTARYLGFLAIRADLEKSR